jgi:hypothetical protein
MKHGLINAIGALAGLATGLFLVPQPLLAYLSSVHVEWDASQCPPGDYSVTSTATNLQTGESFQTTSGTFNLPAAAIGQDFPDLPNGTYRVQASVDGTDGQSFHSATQTLTVGPQPPAPPIVGDPAPQPPPTGPTPGSGQDPASGSGSPAGSGDTPPSGGGAAPELVAPPGLLILGDIPMGAALNLLSMFPTQLSGEGVGIRQFVTPFGEGVGIRLFVTPFDVDGDGTVDFISLSWDTTVLSWRVVH